MKNISKSLRKFLILTLFFSLILSPTISSASSENVFPSGISYKNLDKEIEDYVENHKSTTCGLNLIVYDSNGIVYENSFGYLDKQAKLKSDSESVYEWGSISKLLIWVSIMQLYEEGKIDLKADIKEYLPEGFLKNLSFDKPIRVMDLMNHQAGFQDTYFIQTKKASDIISLEKSLSIRQPRQVYEPGAHTAYSNWGAALAAFIVQRVSGMDYVEYVNKNIFQPLDMKQSTISPTYTDNDWVLNKRKRLKCYDLEGESIDGNGIYYIYLYPAGSAMGTIGDLAKFAKAITPNDKRPSPLFKNQKTLDEIYKATSYYSGTDIEKNYHGFFASEYGIQTIGHGGNTFGCSSMLQFDPLSGIGMVVMTNQAHETTYNYDMYELIFGKFKDSKLFNINRELPNGLILNTRGIIKGPLSFLGAMGVSSYGEEDLENWWYEKDGVVETQYSDFIISTPKAITNILCMAFFIIAGIYGLLNIVISGIFIDIIKNKKNPLKTNPILKYSYILSFLMSMSLINLIIIFLRLSNGYRTGDIGSVSSYIIQSAIFIPLLILMGIIIFKLIKNSNKDTSKKLKHNIFVTTFLAMTQVLVILNFEMYKFWGF